MSTLYDVMSRLYDAGKDNMGADSLRDVGNTLADLAESHANDMRDVVDGISCLVSFEGESGPRAGSFQAPGDVFVLLGAISRQFDMLAGMIGIAKEATWKADQIEQQSVAGGDHE